MSDLLPDSAVPFRLGDRLGPSTWLRIDQAMIDRFGSATLDPDPMHVDPRWAKDLGPFGTTIAFGFLTVALLTYFYHDASATAAVTDTRNGYVLNYGFDRLRLVSPVPVDSDLRATFDVAGVSARSNGTLITFDTSVEMRAPARTALIARWLALWLPPGADRLESP